MENDDIVCLVILVVVLVLLVLIVAGPHTLEFTAHCETNPPTWEIKDQSDLVSFFYRDRSYSLMSDSDIQEHCTNGK